MDLLPVRFIGEEITVGFDQLPLLEKKPPCPDNFFWHERTYSITAVLSEWHSYGRRGRMAQNMSPAHSAVASERGSWGVGRFYFRVHVATGQVFDIYYDRAPKSVDDRKGNWFLYRELSPAGEHGDG